MIMRLRKYATDHRWPHWVRVLLAVPGTYSVARKIWDWPRSAAALEAVANTMTGDRRRTILQSAARILAGYEMTIDMSKPPPPSYRKQKDRLPFGDKAQYRRAKALATPPPRRDA